jgi:hypothetical protein
MGLQPCACACLDGRAGHDESARRVELAQGLDQLRALVLQAVALVHDHELPLDLTRAHVHTHAHVRREDSTQSARQTDRHTKIHGEPSRAEPRQTGGGGEQSQADHQPGRPTGQADKQPGRHTDRRPRSACACVGACVRASMNGCVVACLRCVTGARCSRSCSTISYVVIMTLNLIVCVFG